MAPDLAEYAQPPPGDHARTLQMEPEAEANEGDSSREKGTTRDREGEGHDDQGAQEASCSSDDEQHRGCYLS